MITLARRNLCRDSPRQPNSGGENEMPDCSPHESPCVSLLKTYLAESARQPKPRERRQPPNQYCANRSHTCRRQLAARLQVIRRITSASPSKFPTGVAKRPLSRRRQTRQHIRLLFTTRRCSVYVQGPQSTIDVAASGSLLIGSAIAQTADSSGAISYAGRCAVGNNRELRAGKDVSNAC